MPYSPRIKNFIRKVKIEEVGKSHNYFNNGIKYQIPVSVEYVENFSIDNAEDCEDIFLKEYNKLTNLIKFIFVQGLIDVNAKSKCKLRRQGRKAAKEFFKIDNKYFIEYCKTLNLNPFYMLGLYRKIKKSQYRKISLLETMTMKKFSKFINNSTIFLDY